MKKLILTLSLIIYSLSLVYSQTYYTRAAGAWNDNTSVWSTVSQTGAACSCNPGTSIAGSNTVYVYNTINSYNVLASLSGSGKLIIEAGDSATINVSNLSLSGSSSITVNGTLILYGALTMAGSSSITINNSGTVYVYGNISNSGSASVADNGSLTVHGNVSTSGSAGFTGSGKSYIIGTVTGPNTSMLSVLPDFFSSFSGAAGTGLVTYKTSPSLAFLPLQYNNNASTVLTGNGTFANVSTFSPWVQSGTNLYYTAGNVGIGTSGPLLYPLVVQGTALVNGTLFANNISAANGMSVGTFRIVNGAIDSVDSLISNATVLRLSASSVSVTNNFSAGGITGTTVSSTGPVTVGTVSPSLITLDGNAGTITSPSGNIGFGNNNITTTGTISANAINLNKLSVDSATVPVLTTSHIRPILGDSIIHIGDSSFYLFIGGYSAGDLTFYPGDDAALGSQNYFNPGGPPIINSFAVGHNNTVKTNGAIAIGYTLVNNIPASIMMGFNNPALFIGGNNNVGIGTTTPQSLLQIGTNNNAIYTGGPVNVTPSMFAHNIIQSYIGFNVVSNGSGGWQNQKSASDDNTGCSAILTDEFGYMNFVSLPTGGNIAFPFKDLDMATNTQMVICPSGVLIRNHNTNAVTPTCTTDPAVVFSKLGVNYVFAVGGSMTAQEILIQPCTGNWCDYVFDKTYELPKLSYLEKYIAENKHLPGVPSAQEVKEDGIKVAEMDATLLKKIEELTLYTIKLQKQVDAMHDEITKLKQTK